MYKDLILMAKKLRQDTFNAFVEHGEAHLGGSFSMIEMLIALYEVVLKQDDKFILSKAHASFPLCLLLKEKGYDPKLGARPITRIIDKEIKEKIKNYSINNTFC